MIYDFNQFNMTDCQPNCGDRKRICRNSASTNLKLNEQIPMNSAYRKCVDISLYSRRYPSQAVTPMHSKCFRSEEMIRQQKLYYIRYNPDLIVCLILCMRMCLCVSVCLCATQHTIYARYDLKCCFTCCGWY